MSDIVDKLRSWVYTDSLYATAIEAAEEIERLRSRVRFVDAVIRSGDVAALTDEEREALEWAVSAASNVEHPAEDTLRGLLWRLSPPAT
jgi:hypothetical protein